MATRVTLRDLVVDYGNGPVVDGISLDVDPGSLLALLGPSGCGKSTTLRAVAGLLQPRSGDILFDGASVLQVAPERRPVAMVFQSPLLFPHMSIGDNVSFGLRMRGVGKQERRKRALEALERVRLPGVAERRPGQLSGGQEQRVSLARALVVAPEVLLLDEPFSALDASLRVEVRQLVAELQREAGVTTLFVTHDQEEATVLADRVALVLDGRLVQLGTPRELYERPASLQVARFFGTANAFDGVVTGGVWRGPLGEVPVTAQDGPGALVVRQEAVRVVGPHDAGVDAVVVRTSYAGTAVRAWADAGGTEVALVVEPTTRLTAGARIRLQIPPEHCTVVHS
ncbi:MAG: ABC transporter ATP-binding protein [Frankiales bacterium]|nr:ABC transporter ATP-binding protein [Frankiales bacterium]